MELNLNKDSFFIFNLNKKLKKYNLDIIIKSKYFNYKVFSKISYEELIRIIENVENMLFCKYRYTNDIDLNKIRFDFDQLETTIKVTIKISDNQEYAIILNREKIIVLYNYLTKYLNTLNKVKMMNFNKKYTYVEVRYVDVYSSRRYSYISEDKSIKIGDIVYVDRAGTRCLAVVESKNEYYYEKAPYPVLETKRVIKIVTRAENYKN